MPAITDLSYTCFLCDEPGHERELLLNVQVLEHLVVARLCVPHSLGIGERDKEIPGSGMRKITGELLRQIRAGEGTRREAKDHEGPFYRIDYSFDLVHRDLRQRLPYVQMYHAFRGPYSGFRILRRFVGSTPTGGWVETIDRPLHLGDPARPILAPRTQKQLGLSDEDVSVIAASLARHKIPTPPVGRPPH